MIVLGLARDFRFPSTFDFKKASFRIMLLWMTVVVVYIEPCQHWDLLSCLRSPYRPAFPSSRSRPGFTLFTPSCLAMGMLGGRRPPTLRAVRRPRSGALGTNSGGIGVSALRRVLVVLGLLACAFMTVLSSRLSPFPVDRSVESKVSHIQFPVYVWFLLHVFFTQAKDDGFSGVFGRHHYHRHLLFFETPIAEDVLYAVTVNCAVD